MPRGKSKKKIVVNFILDETASMWDVADATITGFNEYIDTLKKNEKANILLSLTKFNSEKIESVNICDPISKIKELTRETYHPANMTPLYDAIGQTVKDTEKRLKEIKGKPTVLCVVQTDGYENCSQTYDLTKIRSLISEKERDGWTFVYLGANQDAWSAGGSMGISMDNTLSYTSSAKSVNDAFTTLTEATISYASSAVFVADAGGVAISDNNFFGSDGSGIDLREGEITESITKDGTTIETTDTDIDSDETTGLGVYIEEA